MNPIPVRGLAQSLPEDLEGIRAVTVTVRHVEVRMVSPEVVKGAVDYVVPA